MNGKAKGRVNQGQERMLLVVVKVVGWVLLAGPFGGVVYLLGVRDERVLGVGGHEE